MRRMIKKINSRFSEYTAQYKEIFVVKIKLPGYNIKHIEYNIYFIYIIYYLKETFSYYICHFQVMIY